MVEASGIEPESEAFPIEVSRPVEAFRAPVIDGVWGWIRTTMGLSPNGVTARRAAPVCAAHTWCPSRDSNSD